MCSPELMATAVGVQGGLQFAAQRQAYKMQKTMQARASELQRQQTLKQYTASNLAAQQQQEEAARRAELAALQNRAAMATQTARRSEQVGITEADEQDLLSQYGRFREVAARQQERIDVGQQLQQEEMGFAYTQNMVRINKPLQKPDPFLSALDTGIRAAQAYKTFSS